MRARGGRCCRTGRRPPTSSRSRPRTRCGRRSRSSFHGGNGGAAPSHPARTGSACARSDLASARAPASARGGKEEAERLPTARHAHRPARPGPPAGCGGSSVLPAARARSSASDTTRSGARVTARLEALRRSEAALPHRRSGSRSSCRRGPPGRWPSRLPAGRTHAPSRSAGAVVDGGCESGSSADCRPSAERWFGRCRSREERRILRDYPRVRGR